MVRITISGHPGSGTSTLVGLLENELNWTSLNGGQVFRDAAVERGMGLTEFGELCKTDLSVDKSLDAELQRRMQLADGPDIVESRLAGWWAHNLGISAHRIWVDVSAEERASRVVAREGGTIEQRMTESAQRIERDQARFDELYQIRPEDPTPYTHIIKTDDLEPQMVMVMVLGILNEAI